MILWKTLVSRWIFETSLLEGYREHNTVPWILGFDLDNLKLKGQELYVGDAANKWNLKIRKFKPGSFFSKQNFVILLEL